eukprot:CAMPEP_0184020598 /NCGR_PEP_ID=MMETSP0954-20121128/9439_1 /TAXON_ID=627963 /ORGANISM="Aplanochytrium sp, Strain PBS07" /LENGTH=574 /DNA_ID=CAMNT_0026302479 /DNA_START=786 /DNA_END=2511 /DNA_ORIENTATION=-
MVLGEPVGGDEARAKDVIVFEFNKNKKGWNYGWVANKHTCDSEHVLRSYIFEQLNENSFKCVYALDSPKFTLFCRRRQRQNLADLPVQLRKQLEMQQKIKKQSKQSKKNTKTSFHAETKVEIKRERISPNKRKNTGETVPEGNGLGFFSDRGEWNASPFFEESSMLLQPSMQLWATGQELTQVKKPKTEQDVSPARKDEIVCKIIQALLRVDIKDKNKSSSNDANVGEVSNTDDGGFADFFDNLMPEGWQDDFFDSVMSNPSSPRSDSSISESDLKCFDAFLQPMKVDVESLNDRPVQIKSKESLLEALAKYLVEEDGFTKAIQKAFSNGILNGKPTNECKRVMIDVFAEEIEAFLQRSGATMRDLEKVLKSGRKSTKTANDNINRQIENFSPRPKPLLTKTVGKEMTWMKPKRWNLTGTWRRDKDTLQVLEKVRGDIGVPWIVRKLYRKMEKDFIIQMTDSVMELQYESKNKVMSNGVCQYVLDGKERLFTMTCPLPMQKSDRVSYRAYIEGNSVIIIHNYDKNNRMIRNVSVTEDGSKLQSNTTFEVKEGNDCKWVERGRWVTGAYKSKVAV